MACKAIGNQPRHVVTIDMIATTTNYEHIQPSLRDANDFRYIVQAVNDLPKINRHSVTKRAEPLRI